MIRAMLRWLVDWKNDSNQVVYWQNDSAQRVYWGRG